MKKDIIKTVIRDNQIRGLPEIKKRKINIPVNTGKIITVTGVRRCGKTFLLYDAIKNLIDKNIKAENILYINFEDERLSLNIDEIDLVIQSYRELFPDNQLSEVYFFFDEIQNIDGWEKFIRRIYDTISKNIFITGSNSHLLSSEIATSLRGRSINYEIYPLSFSEYLDFQNIKKDLFNSNNKAQIFNSFNSYLSNGGFPEVLYLNNDIKTKTLQEYYNVMIYRDIIERYNITNLSVLKYFIKRIFESVTKPFSVNKVYNELKSQGYKIGKNSLYEFLNQIESVYLTLPLKKYSNSVLKQELSEKKYYCIDNGLLNAITFSFTNDFGKLLENLIFLELTKSGKNISFIKNGKECDFIITEKEKIETVIQSCYSLSDIDTKNREINSLISNCGQLKIKNGIILSMDEEDDIQKDGIAIEIIPAYKYFLK